MSGVGYRVSGVGCRVSGIGCRMPGAAHRVSGVRVGSGFAELDLSDRSHNELAKNVELAAYRDPQHARRKEVRVG